MADISKINLYGTEYDIQDATARDELDTLGGGTLEGTTIGGTDTPVYLSSGALTSCGSDIALTTINGFRPLLGTYVETSDSYLALNIYIQGATSYGTIPILVAGSKWAGVINVAGTYATSSFTDVSTYDMFYGTEPENIRKITDDTYTSCVRVKLTWSSSATYGNYVAYLMRPISALSIPELTLTTV